jgi:hypothetical protein
MNSHNFEKQNGCNLWHRRMGHSTNQAIWGQFRASIKCTTRLESLIGQTFESHVKCAACMLGKAKLEDYPQLRVSKVPPMYQINMDSFSSSVKSIEGYNHAVVFVDKQTGYRWLYGMKTKKEMISVVKRWYSDIADLRAKHKLVVFVRDNAGENKSKDIKEFFESVGVRNHFSTAHEQWQNGPTEATINSIMLLARTVMAESGLGGRFWFRAAMAGKDARNAIYAERLKTSSQHAMYKEPKDVLRFRSFGCKAFVYLCKDRRQNGKHIARAVEAVNLTQARTSYIFRKGRL